MRILPLHAAALVAAFVTGHAARAADYAFDALPPPPFPAGPGDGYRVPRWPVRPAPLRFDAYGFPVPGPFVGGGPNPLAVSGGCPPALEPVYDGIGNFSGYAPIPMCR